MSKGWQVLVKVLAALVAVGVVGLVIQTCAPGGIFGRATEERAVEARAVGDRPTPGSPRAGPGAPDDAGLAAVPSAAQIAEEELDEPPLVKREPHWLVKFFTPRPDEDLIGYRDRVLPVVQAVARPHRVRVARLRQEFEQAAGLTDAQRRELDTAVSTSAEAMKDRIWQAVLGGELMPPRVKPSTAVAFARDLLELTDQANRRFRAALRSDQLTALDGHRFDVAEYLFFATRWEDLLGVTEE